MFMRMHMHGADNGFLPSSSRRISAHSQCLCECINVANAYAASSELSGIGIRNVYAFAMHPSGLRWFRNVMRMHHQRIPHAVPPFGRGHRGNLSSCQVQAYPYAFAMFMRMHVDMLQNMHKCNRMCTNSSLSEFTPNAFAMFMQMQSVSEIQSITTTWGDACAFAMFMRMHCICYD